MAGYTTWQCEACPERQAKKWNPHVGTFPLPRGWEAEPYLRCAWCVVNGRMPAPMTVTYVEPRPSPKPPRPAPAPKPEPPPLTSHRTTQTPKELLADAALRAHPERGDAWLAADAGVSGPIIRARRKALELAGEIPTVERVQRRDGKWRTRTKRSGA